MYIRPSSRNGRPCRPHSLSSLLLAMIAACGFSACGLLKGQEGSSAWIRPGEPWPDDQGNHVQAHGGGIIREGDTFFWFGEYRGRDAEPGYRYVGCYSSKDLAHWTFRKKFRFSPPEGFSSRSWVLERPKVYHNRNTGKFVMYVHLDDGRYRAAEVGVAVSETVDGEYRWVRHFRPLGKESRDIGQFIDNDGSAYLIFESRPSHGFYIASLSPDYLEVDKEVAFIKQPLEGGALVHYRGLYYMIGSRLTGWSPNPNEYATAPALAGPWSPFRQVAPPETKTYGSQSTLMLKVAGSRDTAVIFMGDIWKPRSQWDSRYLWMPLEIGEGRLWLTAPRPWTINVSTGRVRYH